MRKFAHIDKQTGKVVNVFDWKEEKDPDLGKENFLLDITQLKEKPNIGDIYNKEKEEFTKPVEEEIEEKPKTIEDFKREILEELESLREKILNF